MEKQGILEKNIKYDVSKEGFLEKNSGKSLIGDEEVLTVEGTVLYPGDILSKYVENFSWNQYSDFNNWSKWTAR
jgi:hypothetical protein